MSADHKERGEPVPVNRWRQILWFIGLWLGGVAALGTVAYGIRLVIKAQFPT